MRRQAGRVRSSGTSTRSSVKCQPRVRPESDQSARSASTTARARPKSTTTLWALIKSRSYDEKEKLVGREVLRRVERDIMLQIVDQQWKDHLYSLDHLKEGIGLRGYGQRDPLVEYKRESFELFTGDEGSRWRKRWSAICHVAAARC